MKSFEPNRWKRLEASGNSDAIRQAQGSFSCPSVKSRIASWIATDDVRRQKQAEREAKERAERDRIAREREAREREARERETRAREAREREARERAAREQSTNRGGDAGFLQGGNERTYTRRPAPPSDDISTMSCNELWYARNRIFHQYGYCFRTARGKRSFSNDGCHRSNTQAWRAMGSANRARVNRIKYLERSRGC